MLWSQRKNLGGGGEVKKNTNEPKFTRMKMKNDGLSVSLSAREKI